MGIFKGLVKVTGAAMRAAHEADKRNTAKQDGKKWSGKSTDGDLAAFARENGYVKDRHGNWVRR